MAATLMTSGKGPALAAQSARGVAELIIDDAKVPTDSMPPGAFEETTDSPRLSAESYLNEVTWDDEPHATGGDHAHGSDFHWEFLPKDTLYPFYLADTKASRLAGQWLESRGDHTLLDGTLGGRFGVFRYVDETPAPFTRGFQVDVEAAAQIRLDMDWAHDVRSVDFRAGVPLSASFGRLQTRFGYYHLSSHVGDEYLLRFPEFDRQNYSRDVLFLGGAYWLSDRTRVYGEAGWAFYSDVSEPWEFAFGVDSAPQTPTGVRGAPFFAVNGRLREELDFGGDLTAQVGWAWRSVHDTGLLRAGLHYFNGKSNQFSFYDQHEEIIGAGLWYDF